MEHAILVGIGFIALAIEVIAVAIIVVGVLYATGRYLFEALTRPSGVNRFLQYKMRLGQALLIGLEILVAADVIRTIALEPTLSNVAILGFLVLIRTFLSWSLVVEIEGRWPWQAPTRDDG